jgi:hypothetical protein
MNLFEVSYRSEDGKERKIRVVASSGIFAINEVFRRRHGGNKNTSIHVEDQGLVFVAEPPKAVREALLSRTVRLGTIMDAIDEEIANIEIDLERHRKTVDRITAIKNKLAEKSTY